MKIKNISVGDSVQVKKRLVSNIFRAKQVCEVIKINSEQKFRPDVLIKGEYCLEWVNHKDLKKPIKCEPEPQLKQLDQSIFNGLDEKWRFAMVSSVGIPFVYDYKPTGMRAFLSDSSAQLMVNLEKVMRIDEYDYDASNWQNSLIERDIAKELLEVDLSSELLEVDLSSELLEVDLSSELTGSELCKAMLARGDKYVLCQCWDSSYADIEQVVDVINGFECTAYKKLFAGNRHNWEYAIPINNQGEPLTASEVGL